ncbi:MAG: hypothetical protein CR982_03425 [Candidatus Cloacimonadota bacterium]|nr:MAG: hypothetical protein CR982_03425 [Candidatus Cloacimonadota bacterium]PIE78834.1 MAG: hypothetical protein CSA15_05880 [Candidatus Delongbacteria bacterium]
MLDIDIEEIIRAMQDKAPHITYYLNRETGEIVHIDENVADEVEQEYEEADTVLEEWGADAEDDDMYYEKNYSLDTDDFNEKDLIKQIRFTKQDDFEPIETLTLKQSKNIFKLFLEKNPHEGSEEDKKSLEADFNSLKDESEFERLAFKYLGKKEEWITFYHDQLVAHVMEWLKTSGLDYID